MPPRWGSGPSLGPNFIHVGLGGTAILKTPRKQAPPQMGLTGCSWKRGESVRQTQLGVAQEARVGLHEVCMPRPAGPERQEITSWFGGPLCCVPPFALAALAQREVAWQGRGSLLHPRSWEPSPHTVPHSYRKSLQGFLPAGGSSESCGRPREQLVPSRVALL